MLTGMYKASHDLCTREGGALPRLKRRPAGAVLQVSGDVGLINATGAPFAKSASGCLGATCSAGGERGPAVKPGQSATPPNNCP